MPLEPHGCLVDASGGPLGASCESLGACWTVLKQCGEISYRFGVRLRTSWELIGDLVGASWEPLGAFGVLLRHLGCLWKVSRDLQGVS